MTVPSPGVPPARLVAFMDDRTRLASDVAALLSGRVPTHVLDRVLLELREDRAASDEDLTALLTTGVLVGSLRERRSDCLYLMGVRTAEPLGLRSRLRMYATAY